MKTRNSSDAEFRGLELAWRKTRSPDDLAALLKAGIRHGGNVAGFNFSDPETALGRLEILAAANAPERQAILIVLGHDVQIAAGWESRSDYDRIVCEARWVACGQVSLVDLISRTHSHAAQHAAAQSLVSAVQRIAEDNMGRGLARYEAGMRSSAEFSDVVRRHVWATEITHPDFARDLALMCNDIVDQGFFSEIHRIPDSVYLRAEIASEDEHDGMAGQHIIRDYFMEDNRAGTSWPVDQVTVVDHDVLCHPPEQVVWLGFYRYLTSALMANLHGQPAPPAPRRFVDLR